MESQNARFTLRINKELYDQIKFIAEKNKRSLAKQIEYMLEQYVNKYND